MAFTGTQWVYGFTPAEICVGRIEVPTRPLLARYADPVRAAGELFESRKSDYARVADLLISTNDRNVEEVSEIIYGELVKCIEVNGEIAVPASKSIAQRAIIAAMLAEESTYLCDVSLCDDTKRAIDVAKTWGAEVREMGADYLIIPGAGGKREGVLTLFCGESGLLTRMLSL